MLEAKYTERKIGTNYASDMDQDIKTPDNKTKIDDIETSVHMHPHHSIGWLHIHGWVPKLATTGYDIHGHKNRSIREVIKYIENKTDVSHYVQIYHPYISYSIMIRSVF